MCDDYMELLCWRCAGKPRLSRIRAVNLRCAPVTFSFSLESRPQRKVRGSPHPATLILRCKIPACTLYTLCFQGVGTDGLKRQERGSIR